MNTELQKSVEKMQNDEILSGFLSYCKDQLLSYDNTTLQSSVASLMFSIIKNPTLRKCSAASLYSCLIDSLRIGLPIDGVHASCISFYNKNLKAYEAVFCCGYKGLMTLYGRLKKNVLCQIIPLVCSRDLLKKAISEGTDKERLKSIIETFVEQEKSGINVRATTDIDAEMVVVFEVESGNVVSHHIFSRESLLNSLPYTVKKRALSDDRNEIWVNQGYAMLKKTAVKRMLSRFCDLYRITGGVEILNKAEDYDETIPTVENAETIGTGNRRSLNKSFLK